MAGSHVPPNHVTIRSSSSQVLSADAGLPEALGAGDGGLGSLQQQGHGQQQHQQLPAQFYGSGIYSGAAAYHPGATAAFQAAAYEAPQIPGERWLTCVHQWGQCQLLVGCWGLERGA